MLDQCALLALAIRFDVVRLPLNGALGVDGGLIAQRKTFGLCLCGGQLFVDALLRQAHHFALVVQCDAPLFGVDAP